MRAREVARFLRVFGDGTRLRILFLLARSPLSVGVLARTLRCPAKRVSRHLQYLAARGVVVSQAERGRTVYHLCPPAGPLHTGALASLAAIRGLVEEAEPDRVRAEEVARGCG